MAVIILTVAETGIAHAAFFDISSIALKALGWFGAGIGYIFGFLAGIVFSIGGALITVALGLNKGILSQNSIVLVGWPIVLNFANLGFVLAIIIIAFATIFRSQTYGMKQALWKLIVAALLVNFSLVIAGAFISIADTTTEIFINQATGEGAIDFSTRLAGLFKAQQYLQAGDAESTQASIQVLEFGGGLLTFLAQIIFGAGFTLLAALTLLAIAIMLLIRYVVLSILLIIVPLVWLLWIFPATQENWKKWWKEFIRWTFFAPIVSFFMMLAVVAIKKYPDHVEDVVKIAVDKQENIGGTLLGGAADLVVVMGLLLGGLYAANKMSITFASTAFGAAQGAGKAFGGWAGRKGVRIPGWGFAGPSQRSQQWAQQGGIKGALGRADVAVRGKVQGSLQKMGVVGKPFQKWGQTYRGKGEHKNFVASVFGGVKSGSGLFKAKGERREKAQSQLNGLYSKKTALQQERDYLGRIQSRTLDEDTRFSELKIKTIPDVDKKIKELEDTIK